jgi:acetyl-CoA carboxylase biotin carboxyl carrier protein
MSDAKISRKDLDAILKLVESADHIAEFELKYGDVEVRLSRAPAAQAAQPGDDAPPAPRQVAAEPRGLESSAPRAQAAIPAGAAAVKSPMVGTFYRAPSPGAPPFVEVGQAVQADTVVCIIEVMKLMNSIPAGSAGTVAQILVEDGQPVEFGQRLIVIEPAR